MPSPSAARQPPTILMFDLGWPAFLLLHLFLLLLLGQPPEAFGVALRRVDGSKVDPAGLVNNWTDPAMTVDEPVHYRLERFLMANYNHRLIPRRNKKNRPVQVLFTIGLYQIIEVNEPQQYILLNSWIVERWKDELLYWDTGEFEGIREIVLPRESVWIPDTTLYNSLVMDDAGSRRILNVKVNTLPGDKSALVEMLYPTLYQFSCMLDLRFFPYDIQHCVMTFGSWTHDNKNIDYFAYDDSADKIVPTLMGNGSSGGGGGGGEQGPTRGGIGIEHCIPNEGWNILSTDVSRREVKFHCCENNYTLLEFKLHIQRKPLFYLVNLIIPTSIITLIAIVGFFSSSTVNDAREEKISLGITTLLSMSILIFMVSDQMPSTSSFIPLIGWFYTSMMGLISGGTLAASFVIYVQKKGIIGQRPARNTMRWARLMGRLIWMEMPLLMKQAYALKAKQDKLQKQRQQWELQLQKRQQSIQQQQQTTGGNTPPRRPTWWQPKNWPTKMSTQQQQQQPTAAQERNGNGNGDGNGGGGGSALGSLMGRYAANGRAQTGVHSTTFVGPTLGNAMAFLVPAGTRRRKETSPAAAEAIKEGGAQQQPKVSTASMSVSFLEAPAQTHSYSSNASIHEEENSDEQEEEEEEEEEYANSEPKTPQTRECSESLNLIDIDEEESSTLKSSAAGEENGKRERTPSSRENARKRGSVAMQNQQQQLQQQQQQQMTNNARTDSMDNAMAREAMMKNARANAIVNVNAMANNNAAMDAATMMAMNEAMAQGMMMPLASGGQGGDEDGLQQQQQQNSMASTPLNMTNPLVANAAAMGPVRQFAQAMLQRVQQRERERILSEVEARRRASHKPSLFRRSGSSMADLYAASIFPPTPAEMSGPDTTAATLAEASASLAALHPNVQRNLAEIEYDWLAAVLERMFLILFSSLFFLMSLGINGIGLYYWYFTYVDLVEKS